MLAQSVNHVTLDKYATLTEKISGETLFIALALLPPGSDIGTKLHYEMLEYTIVE